MTCDALGVKQQFFLKDKQVPRVREPANFLPDTLKNPLVIYETKNICSVLQRVQIQGILHLT